MNCPECGSDDVIDQGTTDETPPRTYLGCGDCEHEWLAHLNQGDSA